MKKEKLKLPIYCIDCGKKWPEGFKLDDDVWDLIAEKKETLCIKCANKRHVALHDVDLHKDDFNYEAPINQMFWYGYRLGLQR